MIRFASRHCSFPVFGNRKVVTAPRLTGVIGSIILSSMDWAVTMSESWDNEVEQYIWIYQHENQWLGDAEIAQQIWFRREDTSILHRNQIRFECTRAKTAGLWLVVFAHSDRDHWASSKRFMPNRNWTIIRCIVQISESMHTLFVWISFCLRYFLHKIISDVWYSFARYRNGQLIIQNSTDILDQRTVPHVTSICHTVIAMALSEQMFYVWLLRNTGIGKYIRLWWYGRFIFCFVDWKCGGFLLMKSRVVVSLTFRTFSIYWQCDFPNVSQIYVYWIL